MSIPNDMTDGEGYETHKHENEYTVLMKLEFEKLHKEYRVLENHRHKIAHHEGYVHKRTGRLIELLEQDHAELTHEMQNATCKIHIKHADMLSANMKEALRTFDLYQQEIQKKMKKIAEIERHVDRITEKVVKQHFKMVGLHGLSRTMAQRERDLAKAEDRLYHVKNVYKLKLTGNFIIIGWDYIAFFYISYEQYTCKFNVQINENKRLRDEIMDFLLERTQFFNMHNSTKRQIGWAKKKMLNIVQLAIQTYDNRDEAMSKVKALREREAKEVKQHGMDVQDFERTLHHDRSNLDFIKMKLKSRPVLEDSSDRRVRIGSAKERELDAILKKYTKSFKRILAFSKTNSILDLVDKYHHMDQDNFQDFKYITELNNECEVLRGTIETLKSQIEDAHTEVEKREREQRETQQELQQSIITEHEETHKMELQHQENRHRQAQIFSTIAAAMSLTECDTDPIMRLLGNADGICDHNVRLCIQQLEIKITQIKHERDKMRDIKTSYVSQPFQKSVLAKSKSQTGQGGPFVPKVMLFHGESVDDEDAKIFEQEPYYYDEMKEYVFTKMVEDNMVDPVQRSRSVTAPKSKKTSMSFSYDSSHVSLSEKIRQSQVELGGSTRRRKKRNQHLSELRKESTAIDDVGDKEELYRKSLSIAKLGEEAQSSLLKHHTKAGHEIKVIVEPPEEEKKEETELEMRGEEEEEEEEEESENEMETPPSLADA